MKRISFLENCQFDTKPIITMMHESATAKEIRICMGKGSLMREHSAPGGIIIMVLQGEVSIGSLETTAVLKSGDMVSFDPKVPHSLEAYEESVLRLTLSKNDTFSRVAALL